MNGRRAVVGLVMACALLISAVAAQGASAAPTGTTAFTCAKLTTAEGVGFSDAHCKTAVSTGAAYVHKSITTETNITLTNAETGPETKTAEPTLLASTAGGVALELQATGVSGTGKMVNSLSGEAHKASGSGTIVYSGVTVLKPAEKGCLVKGGKVETVALAAETVEGTTPGLKFAPKTGTTFATFTIEGCSVGALNKEYTVTGSIIGTPEGATTVFTHTGTTGQGTLFLGGQKAGIAGKVTIKGESGAGLALTKTPFTSR